MRIAYEDLEKALMSPNTTPSTFDSSGGKTQLQQSPWFCIWIIELISGSVHPECLFKHRVHFFFRQVGRLIIHHITHRHIVVIPHRQVQSKVRRRQTWTPLTAPQEASLNRHFHRHVRSINDSHVSHLCLFRISASLNDHNILPVRASSAEDV